MLSFKRIFATQQQALDVYKSQLSKQKLFVEAFEGAPKGTPVKVALTITETGQSIALDGSVERMMGKTEATQNGFGQRPGLMLDMPITPEIVAPLRAFFLTKAEAATPKLPNAPFMSLSDETATQVEFEVGAFLKKAETGNLFELFGMRPQDARKILRTVYNRIVKNLHPDKHRSDFSDALKESLGDAYQTSNEAYKILQHGVACEIYLEISREVGQHKGMSRAGQKEFQADYRLKNANGIHMADEFVAKAQTAQATGDKDAAMQSLKLALQYDKYNESARSMLMSFAAK